MTDRGFCICVPARNEVERLPILLAALAAQTIATRIPVELCINNSDDGSAAVAQACAARYAARLDIHVAAVTFPPALAHAGSARGRAMAAGHARIGGRGVLISTDADCRPPCDWIEANLTAIDAGADIVGGRIVLDEDEPLPAQVLEMRARLDRYWERVRAIEDAVDPAPHDPPPRHGDHTGASLAIDAALFDTVGGVPALACGEDRALVANAVAAGGRLVHPISVWTRVSARTDGRAAGGMAADMAAMADLIGQGSQPRVPAFAHWRRRAEWRRTQRAAVPIAQMLICEERLPPMPADMPLPAFAE